MAKTEKTSLLKPNERMDDLELSHLKIIQNPKEFSFGMDAVLLSGFAKAKKGDEVLDLGTGTGIIPILMSAKTQASHYTALEIQKESADRARRSVLLNHLDRVIDVVQGDLREADAIFAPASFDVVTANPPYIPAGKGMVNPSDAKAAARHEVLCTFEDVARVTGQLLKTGGHFYLVHRPFRLFEIASILHRHGLEPKRLRLVYPYVDREPTLFLLDCVRGAGQYLNVEKPLIIFKQEGEYSDEIRTIYGY